MQEHRKTGFKKSKVDGHQFDLSVIQDFLRDIVVYNQGQTGNNVIGSLRIYYGKSKRGSLQKADRDLVIVPVKVDGQDLYNVYNKETHTFLDPGVVTNSNPCPNVCEDKKYIFCEDDKPATSAKKPSKKKKPASKKK